ncbi:MAG: four helix bundle protein [Bacteroidota bacterium]
MARGVWRGRRKVRRPETGDGDKEFSNIKTQITNNDQASIIKFKTSRKEAKESAYWIQLINETNKLKSTTGNELKQEADELKKIFSAILEKSK